MNDLITITYNEADEPVVSGRELHEKLNIGTEYAKWFERMCEYGFEEEKDYSTFLTNRSDGLAGKPRTDHAITLDMAKQLCMIQRTNIGRKCREYFIEVEKAWNSDEMIKSRALKIFERDNRVLAEKNNMLEAECASLRASDAEKSAEIDRLHEDLDTERKRTMRCAIQATFFEAVMNTGDNITITEAAKEIGCGRDELIDLCIRKRYLYRAKGSGRLLPMANRKAAGVFAIKEYTPKGGYKLEPQTYVTLPGRAKLLAECVKAGVVQPTLPDPLAAFWEV